jgi:hypothetical protein
VAIDETEFERIKPVLISLLNNVTMLDEVEIPMETMPASYFMEGVWYAITFTTSSFHEPWASLH